jgi:hypothetical protein
VVPFSLGDAEALRTLLDEAGFEAVEISTASIDADFAADTFVADLEYAYGALLPEFVEDPSAFDAFLDAVNQDTRDLVDRHRHDGRVKFTMQTNLATARRPS